MVNRSRNALADLVDDLQSRGRYTFTGAELQAHGLRSDIAWQAAVRRLKQQGRIVAPRRGFYVAVPIEYRVAGCPPASWFIDDLMRHLGQPYYVGLLTAASLHGAAHQQPMAFQVVTNRPTRQVTAGRVRIEFHVNRAVKQVPVSEIQTEAGTMRVSTPEVSAFDLVRYSEASGHLSNVATVLSELAEKIQADKLVALAPLYRVPEVQRLGFLLELVAKPVLAEPLAKWLQRERFRPVPLSHGGALGKKRPDPRWRVIPNVRIEVDL